jgi:hypothetical protein
MSDTPGRLKDLMTRQGGLIVIGPQYLQTTMALVRPDNRKAVFSAAKIDDLAIPDALMIDCALIFAHSLNSCLGRGVTKPELEKWSAALLAGIVFKPAAVPGLAPGEIAEPKRRFTADEKTNELILLVQWGPVPSRHVVDVARLLERAYARIS